MPMRAPQLLVAAFQSGFVTHPQSSLVIEAHHRPARLSRLVTMKPTRGNASPAWNSTFATTRTGGLIEKALAPYDRFVTPPGASAVPRYRAAGCHSPEDESHISLSLLPVLRRSQAWQTRHRRETLPPSPVLLTLNLGQKHFLPVLDTMHAARRQLCTETVSFCVEQQKRVIAGGLKMSVVSTVLLFP